MKCRSAIIGSHGSTRPPTRHLATWLLLGAALLAACGKKGDQKPTTPAKVEKPAKETGIGTITLTEEAERRLAIRLAPIEKRPVARARTLGGEAVVPVGSRVVVAAPVSGSLSPASVDATRPGAKVEKGQALFVLSLTTADRVRFAESKVSLAGSRADAEAAVARAKVEVQTAKITLERVEKLVGEGVGSTQSLDDARAQMSFAKASLAAAEARRGALASANAAEGGGAPIPIESPMAGVLQRVHVLAGQVVPAGAPLVEIVKLDPIWIRVPVYVGDLGTIDTEKEALIGSLTGSEDSALRTAKPISAPPSANLGSATVDLFYELPNEGGVLRPGHSVSAALPMRTSAESLVAPWAAVLHDINGGAWVYENTAPRTYVRRRVQVRHVAGGVAVLASGPKPGAKVVTDGAAELFGAEFGIGK